MPVSFGGFLANHSAMRDISVQTDRHREVENAGTNISPVFEAMRDASGYKDKRTFGSLNPFLVDQNTHCSLR